MTTETKVKELEVKADAKPTQEEITLSKGEIETRRKEITDYYKENIKHLKVQLEYETILKDIEKTRAERVQAQMFLSQATQQAANPNDNAGAAEAFAQAQMEQPPVKRTLKRDE